MRTDDLDPAAWDALTGGFTDVSRYQIAAYADGLRGGSRMSHLLLLQGGQPVAGARVAIIRPPGLPSGVAYLKEGPFWRREGVPADPAVYRAAIAALAAEYGTRRGHCLTVCPRPHPTGTNRAIAPRAIPQPLHHFRDDILDQRLIHALPLRPLRLCGPPPHT